MDSGCVTRREYEEHSKRMEDEHRRQNKRIADLEQEVEDNNKLLVSIERLTMCMKNMQDEQKKQGERLKTLENRDGEMWRKVSGYVITAIVGGVITYFFGMI